MQLPESWLRAWADPQLTSEALAHQLTMAGLEVEEVTSVAPPFSGIVVARIVEAVQHPDADRLRVCQVDDGSGAPLQIVCGAPNARAGILVPLARVGGVLPDGMTLKAVRMRGVASNGMLCSAKELGLSQESAGLLELDAALVPGTDLRVALSLDDTCFTIKLTPNRADCLSVLGVAREIAALNGVPLAAVDTTPVAPTLTDVLPVHVDAPDLCGRFAGRVLRGVNARAETPAYIRQRLERAGQRPISALVDISNYVMLELGRPSHVFDLDKIQGGLTVRWGREGEQLALLNGQTVQLDAKVGVVADEHGVESLAGIMGGDSTAVSLDTTNIYLEAAFWWPEAIAGRSRRFNFSTDAGHRFERGVDFASIPEHIEYITRLILEVCGGAAGPLDDQIVHLPTREPVRMRIARCQRVLGVALSAETMAAAFTRLGLHFSQDAESFTVTPPSYRFDLAIEEDLIEEVARIYGYDNLPADPPRAPAAMRGTEETVRKPHALRLATAALDYQEVVNFSFVDVAWERDLAGNAEPIAVVNPIASHLAVMRTTLIPGLLEIVRHNARRQQTRVRLFELGRVFLRDTTVAAGPDTVRGVHQPLRLGGIAWGPALEEQWGAPGRAADFFDVKADVEALLGARARELRCEVAAHPALHPGRSARLWLGDQPLGWLGELHPRWVQAAELAQAPVVFELEVALLAETALPSLTPVSRQPMVQRDLAFWVADDVSVGALQQTIAALQQQEPEMAILRKVSLFDVWKDKSLEQKEKSLAFRFWLQDTQATLEDARVELCLQRVQDALAAAHGARLRV